jgi:hypothetical protein
MALLHATSLQYRKDHGIAINPFKSVQGNATSQDSLARSSFTPSAATNAHPHLNPPFTFIELIPDLPAISILSQQYRIDFLKHTVMLSQYSFLLWLVLVAITSAQSFFDEPLTEDNANLLEIQRYEQTYVCVERTGDDLLKVVEQCNSVCAPKRVDGSAPDTENGEWVEGSVSCLGEGDWQPFIGYGEADPSMY